MSAETRSQEIKSDEKTVLFRQFLAHYSEVAIDNNIDLVKEFIESGWIPHRALVLETIKHDKPAVITYLFKNLPQLAADINDDEIRNLFRSIQDTGVRNCKIKSYLILIRLAQAKYLFTPYANEIAALESAQKQNPTKLKEKINLIPMPQNALELMKEAFEKDLKEYSCYTEGPQSIFDTPELLLIEFQERQAGKNALFRAFREGNSQRIATLMAAGFNPLESRRFSSNGKSFLSYSAIAEAIAYNRVSIITTFLKRYPQLIHETEQVDGKNLLHLAAGSIQTTNEVLIILINAGIDINQRPLDGYPPIITLLQAYKTTHSDVLLEKFKTLIDRGAKTDFTLINSHSETNLYLYLGSIKAHAPLKYLSNKGTVTPEIARTLEQFISVYKNSSDKDVQETIKMYKIALNSRALKNTGTVNGTTFFHVSENTSLKSKKVPYYNTFELSDTAGVAIKAIATGVTVPKPCG